MGSDPKDDASLLVSFIFQLAFIPSQDGWQHTNVIEAIMKIKEIMRGHAAFVMNTDTLSLPSPSPSTFQLRAISVFSSRQVSCNGWTFAAMGFPHCKIFLPICSPFFPLRTKTSPKVLHKELYSPSSALTHKSTKTVKCYSMVCFKNRIGNNTINSILGLFKHRRSPTALQTEAWYCSQRAV